MLNCKDVEPQRCWDEKTFVCRAFVCRGVRLCMQRITLTYFSSGAIRCRSVYRRALSLIEKHLIVDDTGKA